MATQSLFWYDLETTGRDPARDRILQFAGQRTDLELKPVGPPVNLLCKPPRDVLPDPEAIALTGASVLTYEREGLSEFEFTGAILDAFEPNDTCILGYNSLRFDDEFLRNLFYRNLHDPYTREWQRGRSRWDLIDTVRLCRALRPEGINWPTDETGRPTNQLEKLSAANDLAHGAAHDALSDVQATIAVAGLLRKHQPRLYDFAFKHRDKRSATDLLAHHKREPVLHVSGMYGAANAFLAVVLPVAEHPTNRNAVLVADLSHNGEAFHSLNSDELRDRWFGDEVMLAGAKRFPVKTIHLNRCPVLAPLSVLREQDCIRLDIDLEPRLGNASSWLDPGLHNTITTVLENPAFTQLQDPDLQIYSGGFFSSRDRSAMQQLLDAADHATPVAKSSQFEDDRLPIMVRRMRARNWPNQLDEEEKRAWDEWVQQSLDSTELRSLTRSQFLDALERVRSEQPEKADLLSELELFYRPLIN